MHKQTHMDSIMEVVTNVGIGFFISWAVLEFIIAPLFGVQTQGGSGFLITSIFTVTSVLRSYILRRLFNGRSVWYTIREYFN